MKQLTTTYLKMCFAGAMACFLLPCLYAQLALTTWFPYHLPGKQFLAWYLIHMLGGYLLLLLAKFFAPYIGYKCSLILAGMTTIVALSRICQGLYHHKPVIYLCLLAGINVIILLLLSSRITSQSGKTLPE